LCSVLYTIYLFTEIHVLTYRAINGIILNMSDPESRGDASHRIELDLPPDFPQELLGVIAALVKFGKGELVLPRDQSRTDSETKPTSELALPSEIGRLAVPHSPVARIYRASDIVEQSAEIDTAVNTELLEAQTELSSRGLDIAAKFARAFDEDMPEYRGVFKTIRHLGRDPRRRASHLSTYYIKDIKGTPVQFSYFLETERKYHEKKLKLEKAYTLDAVHIKIAKPSRYEHLPEENYAGSYEPVLHLGFSRGDITRIGISWDEQSDHTAFDAAIAGTVLEAFFTRVSPSIDHKELARKKGYKVRLNRHNISFDLREARLTVGRTFKSEGGGDMDSFYVNNVYELDETGSRLVRRSVNSRHDDKDVQTDFNITFPQSISPEDYLRVVESLFGLIPAH
jgi:hypothetical protein